jgi:hypothetical protein
MVVLSTEQKAYLRGLVDRLQRRRQTALDPRDAQQRRLIEFFLDASNKNATRYPGLHAGLSLTARANAPVSDDADSLRIVDLGCDAAGRGTACAWHGARGGAFISGAATLLVDADSYEPLAFGAGTQVGSTFTIANTKADTAKPGQKMTAVSLFHSQRSPEDPPRFGLVTDTRIATPGLAASITAPTVQPPHTQPYVLIAFARTNQPPDCDYFYNDAASLPTPNLLVPFAGNANLQNNIDGSNLSAMNITAQIYVSAAAAYANLVQPVGPPWPQVSIGTSPNQFVWSFPFDGLAQSQTQSMQFQPIGQANDTSSAFFCEFDVPVNNPVNPTFIFSVCSTGWSNPSTQCVIIPNIQFWWHCLAEGTKVTLADGSTRPIEEIRDPMRVATGLGGSLAVEATARGLHQDLGGPASGVRRLVTEGGRELILSRRHPVVTPDGPVAAEDLQAGQEIRAVTGTDCVKYCEQASFDGYLYDLKLGNFEDRKRGITPLFGSYIANGIVVGDHVCLTQHHHATRHSLDYMLPRLPELHHRDYESALKDIAAR